MILKKHNEGIMEKYVVAKVHVGGDTTVAAIHDVR